MKRYFSKFVLFQHHIHKKKYNIFFTNLNPNFFQLNLNIIQLNLDPNVELNSNFIQCDSIYLFNKMNSIQFNMNSNQI
jgi:hypothetical protein